MNFSEDIVYIFQDSFSVAAWIKPNMDGVADQDRPIFIKAS